MVMEAMSAKRAVFSLYFFYFSIAGNPLVIASYEASFNFPDWGNYVKSLEQMEWYFKTNKRFIACAAATGCVKLLVFFFLGI